MQTFLHTKDSLREKCGIAGVFGLRLEATSLVHTQLSILQHRGQEASGIVSTNGLNMSYHKGLGLVNEVYTQEDLANIPGHAAIGHNRYSTSGGSTCKSHIQPVFNIHDNRVLALAHNGNLPDTTKLEDFLRTKGISYKGRNDSEIMHLALTSFLLEGCSLADAVRQCFPLFTGVFSLLLLNHHQLVAVRDQHGVRPLSMGTLQDKDGFAVASESSALKIIDADDIEEVKPGEMVVVDRHGIKREQLAEPQPHIDAFEFVYFARPDSIIAGRCVHDVRVRMGQTLALATHLPLDLVVPVPDSGISAAEGFAHASGIQLSNGIVRNRFVPRTFIEKADREAKVRLKLSALPSVLRGQRIGLVDDSIVRGTTARVLIQMVREAGAKEVHLLIPSPKVCYPDFYGIDTPVQRKLVAANQTVEQVCKEMGADTLHYLSVEGLVEAIGLPADQLNLSCFNGRYPVDIGNRRHEVKQCSC